VLKLPKPVYLTYVTWCIKKINKEMWLKKIYCLVCFEHCMQLCVTLCVVLVQYFRTRSLYTYMVLVRVPILNRQTFKALAAWNLPANEVKLTSSGRKCLKPFTIQYFPLVSAVY